MNVVFALLTRRIDFKEKGLGIINSRKEISTKLVFYLTYLTISVGSGLE